MSIKRRSTLASLWMRMQAITQEMEKALEVFERPHLAVDSLKRRAAESPGGPTVEILTEDLESMLRDAARYEYLREKWGTLTCTTGDRGAHLPRVVTHIGVPSDTQLQAVDPQTLDQSIDAAIDREIEEELTSRLVVGQCPQCWQINRHEESCPQHALHRGRNVPAR